MKSLTDLDRARLADLRNWLSQDDILTRVKATRALYSTTAYTCSLSEGIQHLHAQLTNDRKAWCYNRGAIPDFIIYDEQKRDV